MSSEYTTITITNHDTGKVREIHHCVTMTHPQWVHDQLGTSSEAELQRAIDQRHVFDWYDQTGTHRGPDSDGLSMQVPNLYSISASLEHDGRLLDASQAEILGDAYGRRYLSEEEAREAAESVIEWAEDDGRDYLNNCGILSVTIYRDDDGVDTLTVDIADD